MTLFVLDTSVALKWILPEPDSPQALAFQDDVRNAIHEIIAPDVFAEEVAHVLTKAERKKVVPVGDAATHLRNILRNGPTLHPFLPLLPRAVEISSATRTAVTDCLFVALAEREGCEVLTADARMLNNLPGYPIVSLDSL
ncbi:MAG: type II toxin-antitoxin system VapC family toxin [Planctomycetes bacterium]|nr:type II toxin-antitoxin system VapC family toxin [Planctomycetota bacterium]